MVLGRLLQRQQKSNAAFPGGRVGFAVGDIHGRADLLAELLSMLEERLAAEQRGSEAPVVIFLGDYVDRGPDTPGVLDLLLSGAPSGYERRFLKGNHEQYMLAFMQAPLENRAWVVQGGAETLISYGVQPPPPRTASEADWLETGEALRAAVPQAHVDFLNRLERYVTFGDYAFVHAGVDAARPIEEQTDEDLFWARERFIASKRPFSHRIVHGHTPVERPYADARRIAVDTGAYASGVLTAARFEGADVSFLSVTDRPRRPPLR